MDLIIPVKRSEPFDDPSWLFDLKLDGYRGVADTIAGRMLSKNGNRMKRFEALLETLPAGYVFDGEIAALDEDGRPRFNDLMFGRRVPVYVPFHVLFVDGEDVRSAPLKERKAMLNKVVRRHRMQRAEPVLGDGRAAFKAVCEMDLEGIVAKRLEDTYCQQSKWFKILNRSYSQKEGRAELFERMPMRRVIA
jgi:bifunctional non-homologous end joining protein LigD